MWARVRRLTAIVGLEAVLGGIIAAIVIIAASLSLQTFAFAYQGF